MRLLAGVLFVSSLMMNAAGAGPTSVDPELQTFRARHGASFLASRDPITNLPTFYYGDSFAVAGPRPVSDADFEARARLALAADGDLLGLDDSTLVGARVSRLALARFGSSDKVAVRFDQEAFGVRCFDAKVTVLFDARSGDVIAIDNTAVRGAGSLASFPEIDADTAGALAQSAALRQIGRAGGVSDIEPVIAGPRPLFGQKHPLTDRGPTLCWWVTLRDDRPDSDGLPARARVLVAATGAAEVLWVENEVRHAVTGKVEARLNQDLDPATPSNLETVPLSQVDIRQGGPGGPVVAVTGTDGTFSIPGNGPLTLYAELRGDYFEVLPLQGSSLTQTLIADVGTPGNFLFNAAPSPAEFDTAQAMQAYFPEQFRQYVKSVDLTDTTMDLRVVSYVNVAASCNAYFVGDAMFFFASDAVCVNTAYSTVSHHEQGHWANQEYNDIVSGSLHEGLADAWAYYISNDPCLGLDFFGAGAGCLRNGVNGYSFCGNANDNCHGEVHASGNVIGGAFWNMRLNLAASLGATLGKDASSAFLIGWLRAFNDSTISTSIRDHIVALDDDDANLVNGTPNLAAIDAAFQGKGFPAYTPPDLDPIVASGPQDGVAVPSAFGPAITAQVTAQVTTVSAVVLHWSTNDGQSYQTTPMIAQGGGVYAANGPALAGPQSVRWYVSAATSGGDSGAWPEKAPSGDFGLYRVGAITTFADFDFETPDGQELGWTHALLAGTPAADADDWIRKAPEGKAASDPDAAYSGVRCYGTDLGQVVSGAALDGRYKADVSTRLLSPPIDLTAATNARLQFRRWIAVEDGSYDQAQLFVNGQKIWENPGTPGGGDLHTADFGWVQQDYDITSIAALQSGVQVEFRLTSDGGLQFGGWQIDDFKIVSVTAGSGSFTTYGAGCAGTAGLVPALSGLGVPSAGGGVGIQISQGAPGATALLYLASAPGSTAIQGCSFLLGGAVFSPVALPLNGSGSFVVTTALPAPLPPGVQIDLQAIVLDPGGPNGTFAATNGLELKVP